MISLHLSDDVKKILVFRGEYSPHIDGKSWRQGHDSGGVKKKIGSKAGTTSRRSC